MEEVLREILSELKEINESVTQIANALPLSAPMYDLDDIHSKIDELGDRITGGLAGSGGKDLCDVTHKLEMIDISISPA